MNGKGFNDRQSNGNNYFFTVECLYKFFYKGGERFDFRGDDDVWVFIAGKLAVDIGGVHGAMAKGVNLDTLGLTKGRQYNLRLFFAERCCCGSNFKFETTLAPAEDCQYSWGAWSTCDGTSERRTATTIKPAQPGGAGCPGPERRQCADYSISER